MAQEPLLLAGQEHAADDALKVTNPYTGATLAQVSQAADAQLQQAADRAGAAQEAMRKLTVQDRHRILRSIADQIAARREELAQGICQEAGKPMRFAYSEADRAVQTFGMGADLIRHQRGEVLDLAMKAGLEDRMGIVQRFPAGPVVAITPFNFPLNLVAHKLSPAIMAGNPMILKPASATPLTALKLGRILLEAGLPPEAISVLPASGKQMAPLIQDERLKVLTFTGSPEVGWSLKAQAGKKKTLLELGGDAAAIIARDADLEKAANNCAVGAFAYAGQVCISLQRLIVEEAVYDDFRQHFFRAVEGIRAGDPGEQATITGPMIDGDAFQRISNWLQDAKQQGAALHFGGQEADRNLLYPTVLEHLPRTATLADNEAFAPVVELIRVPDAGAALQQVNASRYGLQAGLFTHNEQLIKRAYNELELGGLIVNSSPMLRVDNMPYGGVKDSGFGREGVQYSYEEMTEPRLLFW